MADDPFAPLPGARRSTRPAPKSAEWVPLVPVPANAPAPPKTHPELGKPAAVWVYRDPTGRVLGTVCRFDSGHGGKQFRPLTYCRKSDDGTLAWRWQAWARPRPLFNLDQLGKRPNAPVVVVEGEKACDAAARLFPDFVATTSMNGAKGAAHADWSLLAGRRVVIWPDADTEGAAYAEAVTKLLAPIAASIVRITPPRGVVEGWDAGDAVAEGWSCEQAKALVADATDALVPKERGRPSRADPSDASDTEERAPRPRHKDALLDIIDGLELWHSRDKIPFATVPVDTHFENHEVRSRGFRLWLGHEFFKATRAATSSQATEEALRHAESLALYRGTEHEPFIRLGHEASGEVLYLDMCDDGWRSIRIAASGWELVSYPSVKFIRSDHMQPLPIPERPVPETDLGAQLYEDIGALVPLVTEGAITMIISWLVMNFHPTGPYPILDLYGVDGSAKTSTARRIKRFTDPDDLKDRSPPRDELGLCAMARNAWVVAIDNLSYLAPWLSDCICRLATGAGISGRSLYTNADEFWYRLKRPS